MTDEKTKCSDFPPTDFALIVEDQKLHVSRKVLINHSPVFKTMLEGKFKEKDAKEVELHGKSFDDVKLFLMCFYPNMERPLNEYNVLQVYPLAHEYQSPVQQNCETFLKEKARSFSVGGKYTDLLIKYLRLAEKYNIQELLDVAVESASYIPLLELHSDENNEEYNLLSDKTRYLIAERRVQMFEEKVLEHHHFYNPKDSWRKVRSWLKKLSIEHIRVQSCSIY